MNLKQMPPNWIQTSAITWTTAVDDVSDRYAPNTGYIHDIEVLKDRLDALLKTIDDLKADNEYLKDMMNEEFRSKDE